MAVISGTAGSVKYGGTAGTAVGKISEWSLTAERSLTEVLQFGITWADAITSIGRVSGSIVGSTDDSDSMQANLYTALVNGTTAELWLYSGAKYWHGTAYINGIDDTITADGKGDSSFQFTSKNAWEHA
jgi:hypothetical protein